MSPQKKATLYIQAHEVYTKNIKDPFPIEAIAAKLQTI